MKKINLQTRKFNKYFSVGVAAVAIAMLLGTYTPVYADEPSEYSIEITPEMQQNGTSGLDSSDGETSDNSGRITITNDVLYDSQLGEYMYSSGSGYIYSTALNNMITQDSVQITADTGVEFTVYKDGDEVKLSESNMVSDTGSYTVMTTSSGVDTAILSFTIIDDAINSPLSYDLPSTCVVTYETLDGEELESGNRSIDLSAEGQYEIEYMCVRNSMSYSLSFEVDHTAPTLTLNGLKGNKARNKVTITDYEEDATITIQKDGNNISSRTEITQPGSYTVSITDDAGNSSVYSFYILFYLNAGGITFGMVAVIAIIAVIVYLYVSRKRMRVR